MGDAYIRIVGKKMESHLFNIIKILFIPYGHGAGEYILYLFYLLSPIWTYFPSLVQQRDLSTYLNLQTRSLSSLIPLCDLLIENGVKKISPLIVNWLTPISLAFWAMDDGSSSPEGFYLNTHSFSPARVSRSPP